MANAKYVYVFYSVSFEFYGVGIKEDEDEEFFTHVVNGTHPECCFEYGALVDERHLQTLFNLLDQTEDDREYSAIVKTFSEFV